MLRQGQPQRARRLPSPPRTGQVASATHAVHPGSRACDEEAQVLASDHSLVRGTPVPSASTRSRSSADEASRVSDADADLNAKVGQKERLLQTAVVWLRPENILFMYFLCICDEYVIVGVNFENFIKAVPFEFNLD